MGLVEASHDGSDLWGTADTFFVVIVVVVVFILNVNVATVVVIVVTVVLIVVTVIVIIQLVKNMRHLKKKLSVSANLFFSFVPENRKPHLSRSP